MTTMTPYAVTRTEEVLGRTLDLVEMVTGHVNPRRTAWEDLFEFEDEEEEEEEEWTDEEYEAGEA